MDVKDTVNQWLEATIIDIATAEEVRIEGEDVDGTRNNRMRGRMPMDPPVAAGDLSERSRLLRGASGEKKGGGGGGGGGPPPAV